MKIYIDLQRELLQSVYALKEGLSRVQVSQQIRAGKIKTRVIPELDLKLVVVEDVNDPLIEAPAIHHYTNQELSKFFLDLLRANTSKEQEHEAIIKELNAAIEIHKREKEILEIGKAQLTAALNEATDLLEGVRELYKKVVEDNGILTGELNTSIEENTNLARSLDQSIEENRSLTGKIDWSSQEIEKLTGQIQEEKRQNTSLKDRISQLEEEKKSQAIAQSQKDMEELKALIKQFLIERKSTETPNKG